MVRKLLLALLALVTIGIASADVLDNAKALMESGDYEEALSVLRNDAASVKKTHLGQYNQLIGECLYEMGDFKGAGVHFQEAKVKGVAAASLYLGRLAYKEYDFDDASKYYAEYRKLMQKARKPVDEWFEEDESRNDKAKSFLERVEKIAVIDSISVPKEDFFKAYRLPASAGSLRTAETLPFGDSASAEAPVYITESGDRMLWAQADSVGNLRIMETVRLTDGSWQTPVQIMSDFMEDSDMAFPFLMADGVTLYFASDSEDSLGGYDIFVATRDPSTGEFMQPQNLGMPYNSPSDDYLFAVDEQNGVGWWATERFGDPDNVTIFVFVPNELRKNYDPETEDITDFARISDYRATQEDDYSALLEEIASINPNEVKKKADFYFPMSGKRVYTTLDDFRTQGGRRAMMAYLAAAKEFASAEAQLQNMRKRFYEEPDKTLGMSIRRAEQALEMKRESLKKLLSDVYASEGR